MVIESTVGLIKPEAFPKWVGEVQNRIIHADLHLRVYREAQLSLAQAKIFYGEHEGKDFFDRTVAALASDYLAIMVIAGPDAVAKWRDMVGHYAPDKRQPGTIRGDFMTADSPNHLNGAHASADAEAAGREVKQIEFLVNGSLINWKLLS